VVIDGSDDCTGRAAIPKIADHERRRGAHGRPGPNPRKRHMTDDMRETLWRLERALASADPTGIDGGLEGLLADGFLEFGASGRTWDEASMRQTLAGAMPTPPVDLEDFVVEALADDVALVTYRLGPPRPSNRSSVWVRRDGRWRVRFHQGTLQPE
jgi:hypothetical protein